jgi:hypothetical protein
MGVESEEDVSQEYKAFRAKLNAKLLEDLYQIERPYSSGGTLPQRCLALSGGGIRSAMYSIGVMKALDKHDRLDTLDLISSVSGGSYAMSWYFSHLSQLGGHSKELFSDQYMSRITTRGELWERIKLGTTQALTTLLIPPVVVVGSVYHLLWAPIFQVDPPGALNLSVLYNYLFLSMYTGSASTDKQHPKRITDVSRYVRMNHLPGFIYNLTIQDNTSEYLRSHGQIFELSTMGLGSEWSGYFSHDENIKLSGRRRPFTSWEFADAMATSGAATAAPIQGCTTNSILDFCWANYALAYVRIYTGLTLGITTWGLSKHDADDRIYYFLSDGGHSENLGAYGLIKRHCENIIIVDGEEEPKGEYVFEGYTVLKSVVKNRLNGNFTVSAIDAYLDHHRLCEHPPAPGCTNPTRVWKTPEMDGTIEGLPLPNGDTTTERIKISYIKLSFDRTEQRTSENQSAVIRDSCSKKPSDYYSARIYSQSEKDSQFPIYPTTDQWLDDDQRKALIDLGYAHMRAALCKEL